MGKLHIAFLIMLAGALCASSLAPLGLLYDGDSILSFVLASSVVAAIFHLPFVDKKLVLQQSRDKKFLLFSMLGGAFVTLGYAVFTNAIAVASNPYVPTVIFELYPLGIIILSSFFVWSERIRVNDLIWIAFSSVGVVVVLGGEGGLQEFIYLANWEASARQSVLGVILLSIGATCVTRAIKTRKDESLVIAFSASLFARIGGVLALLLIVSISGFSLSLDAKNIMLIIIYGCIMLGLTNICYYAAVQLSETGLINTVWYMTPVFGLIWIGILGEGSFNEFIAIGSTFIIVANIMLNLTKEAKASYRWTVVSIVAFGTIVYFSEGQPVFSYFDAVTAPVLFFALIFGFLADRMTKRTEREHRILLDLLNDKKLDDGETIRLISEISQNSSLDVIRTKYHKILREKDPETYDGKLLDALVLSKTEAIATSELFVVIITALLASAAAIFFRPTGLIYDSFALVVSTSVMYLSSSIYDFNLGRKAVFLSSREEEGLDSFNHADFVVSSKALSEPSPAEKTLIIGLLLSVMAVYHILFFLKHGSFSAL